MDLAIFDGFLTDYVQDSYSLDGNNGQYGGRAVGGSEAAIYRI